MTFSDDQIAQFEKIADTTIDRAVLRGVLVTPKQCEEHRNKETERAGKVGAKASRAFWTAMAALGFTLLLAGWLMAHIIK